MKKGITDTERVRITIRGAVQGVGFRPFVYRLAQECGLGGRVLNSAQGVSIEAEGKKEMLECFLARLQTEKPPHAYIQSLESLYLDPVGYADFIIGRSEGSGVRSALVLPDIAICSHCLSELFDRENRRYLYPFTNCTNCGPRFSIIEGLPYDRANTTMKAFEMCGDCRREYEDPRDRRFHAQPNACPTCGPHVELWDTGGRVVAERNDAVRRGADIIQRGGILAVKGIGGFHLMVDAGNDEAVRRLRERKHREEKPLALMYPTLQQVKRECRVSEVEERLLLSPESPIVLLEKETRILSPTARVAESVAPANPYLGVMLPYSPLHHILMREVGCPVVATSGNLSDEPICIDEREAIERLSNIADVYLVHNRPITRHVDDSVVRIMMGRELVVRRARGYAPLPIPLRIDAAQPLLAVGAHLKNAVATKVGSSIFLSQHIGDLETKEASDAFRKVVDDIQRLYDTKPAAVVCDLHPDYLSTRYARELPIPVYTVQHHYAHVASCMAENELEGQVLGVSWDGTGYGLDGTIWGGEFLLTTDNSFNRVGTFRPFRLPGGDSAVKEPRRTAIGVLYEIFGDSLFDRTDLLPLQSFDRPELAVIQRMLSRGFNTPVASSVGRLFDAVASIIGLRQRANYEGQAAMELEFAVPNEGSGESYEFAFLATQTPSQDSGRQIPSPDKAPESNFRLPCAFTESSQTGSSIDERQSKILIDWFPIIHGVLGDVRQGFGVGVISTKFHNTLTEIIICVAKKVGERRIVLSGGCFQNRYLTETTIRRLRAEGFRPYWHQRVPPNDGGIALGQINAVMRKHSVAPNETNQVRQALRDLRVADQLKEETVK